MLAAALLAPDAGSIRFGGRDVAAVLGARERGLPPPRRRPRLAGVPPDPGRLGAGQRADQAAGARLQPARGAREDAAVAWSDWASASALPTGRSSSRWASASGSRSPARSSASRGCCWPTSRRATSTPRAAREILELLREICRERGIPGLLVTHDADAVYFVDRVLHAARRAPADEPAHAIELAPHGRLAVSSAEPEDPRHPPEHAAVPLPAAAARPPARRAAGRQRRRDRGRARVRRAAGEREPRELGRRTRPRADRIGALCAARPLVPGIRRAPGRTRGQPARACRSPRRCCART